MKKNILKTIFLCLFMLSFCFCAKSQNSYNFEKFSKKVRSIERKNSIMLLGWSKSVFYDMRKHLELPVNFINFQNDTIYILNFSSFESNPIETIWTASNSQPISFMWNEKGIEKLTYTIDTLVQARYQDWESTKQRIKIIEQTKQEELKGIMSGAIENQIIRVIFKDGIPYFDSYIHHPFVDHFWDK